MVKRFIFILAIVLSVKVSQTFEIQFVSHPHYAAIETCLIMQPYYLNKKVQTSLFF